MHSERDGILSNKFNALRTGGVILDMTDMSVKQMEAQASKKVKGAKVVFSGLKVGSTKALIKASNGEIHHFNITVRKSAGWL